MNTKDFVQESGREEAFHWNVSLCIDGEGKIRNKGGHFRIENTRKWFHENKDKINIRQIDRRWVYRNIPSSITWGRQIHHDWKNGGRMYLLTKEEHILLHRR